MRRRKPQRRRRTRARYQALLLALCAGAGLVAFGFADWPLIAYHFAQVKVVTPAVIAGSLCRRHGGDWRRCGHLRSPVRQSSGSATLVPAIPLIAALAAPLAFLGGTAAAMVGLCAGASHSAWRTSAAERRRGAPPCRTSARANAFGIFSAVFGIAWFAGSAALGALYDISFTALVAVSVAAELARLIPAFRAS